MEYHKYPGVEAIFLTCWKFVNWLSQLASGLQVYVALHIDGKHKMHHGKWIFIALGIHCLNFDNNRKKYVHSFRPLLFMLCKQIETVESITMMLDVIFRSNRLLIEIASSEPSHWQALKEMCAHFDFDFDKCGFKANVYDHSSGFMSGLREPGRMEVTCWPHIKGIKLSSGYIPKSHQHFDEVLHHATMVHLAHSEGWKDVLIELIGAIWDIWAALREDPGGHLTTFWESYFVAPWSNWTVGENMHIPCLLPSNQMVEAFFRCCVQACGGKAQLRGSTRKVVQMLVPKIMEDQDLMRPDRLCFQIDYISENLMVKARVLAAPPGETGNHRTMGMRIVFKSKNIIIGNDAEGRFRCAYVLRKQQKYKALTFELLAKYEEYNHGYSDGSWASLPKTRHNLKILDKELEKRIEVMNAVYKVTPSRDGGWDGWQTLMHSGRSCIPCRVNPMKLLCVCKGGRGTGICSHIVAVNHRCGAMRIQSELKRTESKKKKKSRRQATGRRQIQPESSEESGSEIESEIPTSSSSSEEEEEDE